MNKRKEFFRVTVEELRKTAQELGVEAAWTLEAEAVVSRETLAVEQAMKTNTGLKQRWLEEQATLDFADEDQERRNSNWSQWKLDRQPIRLIKALKVQTRITRRYATFPSATQLNVAAREDWVGSLP